MAVLSAPKTRYAFSLTGTVDSTPVGETPTGYRVDIQYQSDGSVVSTDETAYFDEWVKADVANVVTLLKQEASWTAYVAKNAGVNAPTAANPASVVKAIRVVRESGVEPGAKLKKALRWYGLEGSVLSGSDWAIVRADGVAEFTGRLTLGSKDADRGLLDLTLGGPVDLQSAIAPAAVGLPAIASQAAYQAFESGKLAKATVVLAATFNAAGQAESWAPKRMKAQAEGFWKYEVLTESQFVAVGEVIFSSQKFSPITSVELHFYELRAP